MEVCVAGQPAPVRVRRHWLIRSCAALALACTVQAYADPLPVTSSPTDLSGNAELMVSYRHQERLWQTPDGALHLVVNRGTLQPNPGLVLNSSYNGGVTWLPQVVFANTNRDSTVDGELQGSTLAIAYSTTDGGIAFAQMTYDSPLRTWAVNRSESAYYSTQFDADNPTIAFDDLGVAWCGFAAIDRTTKDINIRMIYRPSDGIWSDTGIIIGPTDHISKERSARVVRIPGSMGLLYRVRQSTYWASRDNNAPYTSLSTPVQINEGEPQRPTSDPYASHFSAIADDGGYVHLLIADDGAAKYLRYTVNAGTWTIAKKINGRGKLSYLQIGIANGQIAVALSASRGKGAVLLSQDSGDTFVEQFSLVLPAESAGISYKTGRIETPSRSAGPLAVLQQYEDHGQQRLMVFQVPVP